MTQDLSELINLNKRIVSQNNKLINQNNEIIELLRIIAGSSDADELPMESDEGDDFILDADCGIGSVLFIEEENIFKLTVKNNETVVDNLTGDAPANDFALQQALANESVKRNLEIPRSTVILSKPQSQNLSQSLKICIENGCENIFVPITSMTQLVGAPDEIMTLIKLDFYRSEDELISKVLKNEP